MVTVLLLLDHRGQSRADVGIVSHWLHPRATARISVAECEVRYTYEADPSLIWSSFDKTHDTSVLHPGRDDRKG